jgi:hypothetical protein
VRRNPRRGTGPCCHDVIGAPSTVSANIKPERATSRDGARRSGVIDRLVSYRKSLVSDEDENLLQTLKRPQVRTFRGSGF